MPGEFAELHHIEKLKRDLFGTRNERKARLVDVLKDSARGSSSERGGRFRATLIVAEVALSVVLLVGSSLLLMSFLKLQRTPPGQKS